MAQGSARIGKDRYRTEIDVGGHALIADEPPALGGGAVGPAPYDLLLASLGACTAITLRMYADRKGWPLESVEVGLRLSGREEKRIDRTLAIVGLDDEQRARMADIAERTPVTLTLKAGLPIATTLA
ncbi:MAG TPA: OsmC family protein [Sphingopyxis sp.]|uniref:Osmotically inducible protein C n=1 Tax=Sphingopyxis terrae subsp. terrae NBRC 15098 TaxID=1219058 RepID=A0A142VXQ0_9SPHN|nr:MULTISPECIES: OsmC family protein [Sphingopyxis]AMU94593.1 osmotically inducible protein C [Sphingopyxis terrae subsp. terrae NBRC 15098]QXF13804.1 OsmC family protein [Sphingopyxis terrae subsp. terrae]HMN55206.1 OsmC family protein [Sphingopyxis sp.]